MEHVAPGQTEDPLIQPQKEHPPEHDNPMYMVADGRSTQCFSSEAVQTSTPVGAQSSPIARRGGRQ